MNEPAHNEGLLSDILAEGRQAGLRDALLGETLRLVRRRRRFRQAQRGVSALAVVVAATLLLWWYASPEFLGRGGSKPYLLVRTQPLPTTALVETKPLSDGAIVSSGPNAALVVTVPAGEMLHEINDDDLLALAAPNPAVLVRHGPDSVELVFAPPAGKERP